MTQVEYDCLIIEPEAGRRLRLKQAMNQLGTFRKTEHLEQLQRTLEKLKNGVPNDVLFISDSFSPDDCTNFINNAKATEAGQDSAYVLVHKSTSDEETAHDDAILLGLDGVLFEPYSADKLVEITELASRVRKERWLNRERIRLKRMLPEIMGKLNLAATFKSNGFQAVTSSDSFKRSCRKACADSPESIAIFLELVLEEFEKAEIPEDLPEKRKYDGSSERVKVRIEKRTISELENKLSDESAPE